MHAETGFEGLQNGFFGFSFGGYRRGVCTNLTNFGLIRMKHIVEVKNRKDRLNPKLHVVGLGLPPTSPPNHPSLNHPKS